MGKQTTGKRALGIYAVAAYLFLHVPLLVLVAFSFNASKYTVWTGWSLDWYRTVFHDAQLAEAAGNSILIAICSAAISTVIGTLAAYGMWKRKAPVLQGSLYLSLVTPEIVTGISLLVFFQWIFHWLHFRLGMGTVIIAHVAFSIAYVVIVVTARLETFDPALEEAAMDLGATPWRAFWRVTLPALRPGIIAACLLAMIVSVDDYVTTSFVAGADSETLPMVIYAMARRGVSPAINAISSLIVVLFGVLILISEKLREA
jgi:spermidine/putrescine transport system permease protein